MYKIFIVWLISLGCGALNGAELILTSPVDYQVTQRLTREAGRVRVVGEWVSESPAQGLVIEARLSGVVEESSWFPVPVAWTGGAFRGVMAVPAGGWWTVEFRVMDQGTELARQTVPHFGVGEVFVVAGQSNSANHGEEKQTPRTGLVSSKDGDSWRLAVDPQPGASGRGGSFLPPFADAIVEREGVPVGLVACGIGATSVREWLPEGAVFPNPPTIESRVVEKPDGQWASQGAAYRMFVDRIKSLGPQGFRAVLWHQGESDANQRDPSRTLPGRLYREYLEQLIRDSRKEIGWDAPWFVAQVSYHGPGDEGSEDIRQAQASLWRDGIAFEGPDSDALKGRFRERDGQGVHFSGPGLREHGARWAAKVLPWLEAQWGEVENDHESRL